MQDTRLYEQILGLSDPWKVGRVELNVTDQKVELWVEHRTDAVWNCPTCAKSCPLYDHAAYRNLAAASGFR